MKFIIILLLVIINTFLNAKENSLKKVSLQLHWKHQFEFAGFYMAKEKGFYKNFGLDVKINEYKNNIDVAKSVSKGESTFGVGYPSIVLEKSKGKDIILLSAILQSSPHALVTLKSSKINSLKDFKDKLIMTNKDASSTAPFISMFQSKKLSFYNSKFTPHTFNIDDLINKKVDAVSIFRTNEPFILNKKGIEYKIWDPKDYGFDFYDDILFTSSKTIESDAAMVQGFKEASLEGWEYAFSNIEETVDLIFNKYNSLNKSKEALLYEARELKKLAYYQVEKIGTIDKNAVQRIYDIYNLMGLTENVIDINSFIFSEEKDIFTAEEKKYLIENTFDIYLNEWKPFAIFNEEESSFEGLAIDFWDKIAKTTSINYRKTHSNGFLKLLENVKNDSNAIALSLSITEDRKKFGSFTKPYISYPIAIATNIKQEYILDLSQLENKKVAVGKNYSAHKLLKEHYPNIDFVPVKNTIEALELLANKKVFAAADILPTLSYYLHEQSYSSLKISGTSEFKFQVRIMVNKQNSKLIPILNKAIEEISVDEKKLIHNKWIVHDRNIETIDYKLLSIILTPIILILIFILILNYNQRKYITNLKEKENRIKEQSKKLEERENILSQYVLYSRTDLEGNIIDVSDAFCRVSGYTKKELIGSAHSIIRHPDMSHDFYKQMWETIKSGKTWRGEIKNQSKNGNAYWIDANISPEYNKKGEIVSYVSIRTDITAKKDFEQQHLKLLEQAKMASLGEMLGNIAHQWRQPLNAISTAASGLQIYYEMDNLNKKTLNEFSNLIIKQAQFLSKTIDTFKNFIKNEEAVNKISIQDEILQAIDITKVTLDHNFIKIEDNIDYNTAITVTQRSGELIQIIINILNNSKDVLIERAIENPTIKLELEKHTNYIILKIGDNAGGISEDILPHIFEPYFTTKHKSQGTGLGLYMSYKMATESLKGELFVENDSKGAVFNLKIPL